MMDIWAEFLLAICGRECAICGRRVSSKVRDMRGHWVNKHWVSGKGDKGVMRKDSLGLREGSGEEATARLGAIVKNDEGIVEAMEVFVVWRLALDILEYESL